MVVLFEMNSGLIKLSDMSTSVEIGSHRFSCSIADIAFCWSRSSKALGDCSLHYYSEPQKCLWHCCGMYCMCFLLHCPLLVAEGKPPLWAT